MMLKLSEVLAVAKQNKITPQRAFRLLKKADNSRVLCPECHMTTVIDFYHEDGIIASCLNCDYEKE